jgi:hypothetical protein
VWWSPTSLLSLAEATLGVAHLRFSGDDFTWRGSFRGQGS